jgi:hypothetical protein
MAIMGLADESRKICLEINFARECAGSHLVSQLLHPTYEINTCQKISLRGILQVRESALPLHISRQTVHQVQSIFRDYWSRS